ncbi:hypothetical protein [Corynebacterium pseudopelargi]|uniref:DUF4352 domain-containing protein n=1 Tax=Corynebacterium pseudopelargi TaxID=2080757 RepID=A0A3G6ISH2_9CORY|nr:hypothetical protein [Corynebacterium pseudopelargi]AZA08569.1 hypothetical protein CPPEL_02120 [Corynebacterium pseudopelargi]
MTEPQHPEVPQQPPAPQGNQYPQAPEQQYATQAPKKEESKNVVGIVALVCAVVGFIFACIPGALIIGWVLLPIAFILGIVGLFTSKKRRTAVIAIAVSVVGFVVGVLVFVFVAAQAFDDAFNAESNVSSGDGSKLEKGAGSSRENPLPLGSSIESEDWKVTINSVDLNADDAVLAANTFNDPAPEGQKYILVNYTVEYTGDKAEGEVPSPLVSYVTIDGNTLSALDNFAVAPDQIDTVDKLYEGGSVTGNQALTAPVDSAQEGVLAVNADLGSATKFVSVQ